MSAAEGTPFLSPYMMGAVDVAEVEKDLAQNWGWMLTAGIICLITGFVSLACPVMASDLVLAIISWMLLLVGVIHLTGLCFAEVGLKIPSFILGCAQIALASTMMKHPFTSMTIMTILIALMFTFDGMYRIALATNNQVVRGWKMLLVQGICQVGVSLLVLAAFPASSLYTIGILVGVNFIALGMARISTACVGRSIANTQISGGGGSQPIPIV